MNNEMKECVNCGMPIPTSARVCPYCKTDQPKHYSSETFCYVISGIVLIVAFVLGGVKGPSKKEIQSTLNNELIQETVDLMDIYEEVETYSYSNVYNNTTEKGDIELHNLEQKSITDELIKVVKENDKICKYFDIPLQHISNNVLKNFLLNKSFIPIRKAIIGFFVLKNKHKNRRNNN